MSGPSLSALVRAPKALLHDHLDGGVRPATVIELADAVGYQGLPTKDVGELAQWFVSGANQKDLPKWGSLFPPSSMMGASAAVAKTLAPESFFTSAMAAT